MSDQAPPIQSLSHPPSHSRSHLPMRHTLNHFFLIHDYFFKLVRIEPTNSELYNLQIDINNELQLAVKRGAIFGQAVTFGLLCTYFFKGTTPYLKIFTGGLFIYWWTHIYTLSSYLGLMTKLGSAYRKTGDYYASHTQEKSTLAELADIMENDKPYSYPQDQISRIFGGPTDNREHLINSFFAKNKEKYISPEDQIGNESIKKLKYMDSFLTRYIYFNFSRWCYRLVCSLTNTPLE